MKFYYKQRVKIISGFYRNQTGAVRGVVEYGIIFKKIKYLVNYGDADSSFSMEWIWEKDLESVDVQ